MGVVDDWANSTVSRSGYIWRMPWVCGYWEVITEVPDSRVEAMGA